MKRLLAGIALSACVLPGLGVVTAPPAATEGGRVFYVSPDGSDRAGGRSPGRAWRTLERVDDASLRPGDRVLLERGGTWDGRLDVDESGVRGAPIRIGSYGTGARPRVTGGCVTIDGSHVVVAGIAARDCDWAGFTVAGDRVVLRRVHATGSIAGVRITGTSSRAKVRGSTIVGNTDLSDGGSGDNGAFGVLVNGDHATVVGNRISGHRVWTDDWGWDGAAVEIYGGRHTRVLRNHAHDNNTFSELGDSRTSDTVYAYNLVTGSMSEASFLVVHGTDTGYGPTWGTVADHNTVHLTGDDSEGFVCNGDCEAGVLTLTANIVSAVGKTGYADGPVSGGYNVFSGGQRQFRLARTDVVARPRWAAAASGDYELRRRSAAVDRFRSEPRWRRDFRGKRVPLDGNRRGGAWPDAGAFERRPR